MTKYLAALLLATSTLQLFAQDTSLEFSWIFPKSKAVAKYEKAEWGVKLDPETEKAISNWIENDQKRTTLTPAINPFDPEQVDVWAEITHQGKKERINGFFYIPYTRNNFGADENLHDWKEQKNDYRFRFRYSPTDTGLFRVQVFMISKAQPQKQASNFASFNSIAGNESKSFVGISENKHFFATADKRTFMPVGLNLNMLSYSCECDKNPGKPNCKDCYDLGDEDPCCGITPEHRPGVKTAKLMRRQCAPLAAYEKFDLIREELVKSGANSFRFFLQPPMFDVEYEKMNNYLDRQYQAWELDRMFDDCHEKGLRVQWNLQIHIAITITSYGDTRWDWAQLTNTGEPDPNDPGWCYKNELDLQTPIDFLTNTTARNNYKKKLRYIIARWGYNPDVYLMELMSEMNNLGGGDTWTLIDEDEDGVFEEWRHFDEKKNEWTDIPEQKIHHSIERLYTKLPELARPAVANWHNEMASYIKNELGHKQHLIAADYTGQAPFQTYPDTDNPCSSKFFDNSWQSPNIDVMSISNYGVGMNRWRVMTENEYENYLCTPADKKQLKKMKSNVNSVLSVPCTQYNQLWKPVAYGENGNAEWMDCDYTCYYKDLLVGPLSGHASSGMSWDESREQMHWKLMGMVNKNFQENILTYADFGKGTWQPNHVNSKKNWWDKRNKSSSHNERAEAVYMVQQNSDSAFVAGVVMNCTWNLYTTGTEWCASEKTFNDVFKNQYDAFAKLEPITAEDETIALTGIEPGTYMLRYIDANSGKVMREMKKSTRMGAFTLTDFPTLGTALGDQPPFFFFTMQRIK